MTAEKYHAAINLFPQFSFKTVWLLFVNENITTYDYDKYSFNRHHKSIQTSKTRFFHLQPSSLMLD